MSERLDNAFAALDDAVREVAAAINVEADAESGWVVGHYAVIVGEQRFSELGAPVQTYETLVCPMGGPLTYPVSGLLGRIPALVRSHEVSVSEETD